MTSVAIEIPEGIQRVFAQVPYAMARGCENLNEHWPEAVEDRASVTAAAPPCVLSTVPISNRDFWLGVQASLTIAAPTGLWRSTACSIRARKALEGG